MAHYRLAQTYSTVGRLNRTLGGAELETGGRDGGRLRRSGTVYVDRLTDNYCAHYSVRRRRRDWFIIVIVLPVILLAELRPCAYR